MSTHAMVREVKKLTIKSYVIFFYKPEANTGLNIGYFNIIHFNQLASHFSSPEC